MRTSDKSVLPAAVFACAIILSSENDWPVSTALRIHHIYSDSIASTSGLREGDWIIGAQGEPTAELSDLLKRVTGNDAETSLALKILRPTSGVLRTLHLFVTPEFD